MTNIDVLYRYERRPTEAEMFALGKLREVYGIRKISVNEAWQTVRVEYDATRLNAASVAQLLRGAGLSVTEELPTEPGLPEPAEQPAPAK